MSARTCGKNIIVEKTVNFSLTIISYCDGLIKEKRFVVANQLLRSATAIGPKVFEAQNAESRADFVHKMKIAAKEASESLYWLTLCERSLGYKPEIKFRYDLEDIIRILAKIIFTERIPINK